MADLKAPGLIIKVPIVEDTELGIFRGSLTYPMAEYEAMTDEEVELAIRERVDKWLEYTRNIVQTEPTEEDLLAMKAEHEEALTEIQEKLDEM